MLELFSATSVAGDGSFSVSSTWDAGVNTTHQLYDVLTNAAASSLIHIPNTIMLAICTALVLFMVPGLGLFYSGLLRKKNALHIILQCMGSAAIVTVIWVTFGFSAAFGPTLKGVIGDPSVYAVFRNILFSNDFSQAILAVNTSIAGGVPFILFFLFQLSFAIITPALVVGAFADRLKWRGNVVFTFLFTIFIYIPVCHWIWGGGMLSQYGAIDWAGGIVIHVTCGFAAIASVIVLRKRKILLKESTEPHNIPLVVIGAAILFFGWFGFNTGGATYVPFTGDALGTDSIVYNSLIGSTFLTAGVGAFTSSFLAMAMGMGLWIIFDWIFNKKVTIVGAITGGVAGLATITPAAGWVAIWASLPIGLVGGLICYMCAKLNHVTHFDDALEVWPVHGMGGLTGALLVSGLITSSANPNIANLPTATWISNIIVSNTALHVNPVGNEIGSLGSFVVQLVAVGVVIVWSLLVSILIFVIVRFVFRAKLSDIEQIQGADRVIHGEEAYGPEFNVSSILLGNVDSSAEFNRKEFEQVFENVSRELEKYKSIQK